jgi:hypothetical protein
LGDHASVIEAIRGIVPDAEFSRPELGFITRDSFATEIWLGADEPVDTIILKVVGGDGAVELIADILQRFDSHAFDIQTGELFELEAATASFAEWSSFRDRMLPPPS